MGISEGGKWFELTPPTVHKTKMQTLQSWDIPSLLQPKAVDATQLGLHSPDVQPLLKSSMDDFNRSMRRWTEQIERQVFELDRNCNALKNYNDLMNAKCMNGW